MTQVEEFEPLFAQLPLDRAMPHLLVIQPGPDDLVALVEAVEAKPAAKAALWLYVDHLEKAHQIVQELHTPTGAFLHAIVHRREGDYWNSKYWFRQAGHHPVIDDILHYEPYDLVDRAQAAGATNPADLVALQRAEWKAVFDHALQEEA